MQQTLNYILNNYTSAKNEIFGQNIVADYIRNNAKENIYIKAKIDNSRYTVDSSPGKGRWTYIPWIAVFDKDITHGAQRGYYIVYLFCADMSGVYLSLNQGWAYFEEKYKAKKGREKISIVSNIWKKMLSSASINFSLEPINLKGISKKTHLSKGYELGHICGKFYQAGKIPDDSILIEDLRNLMGVYRELKGKLKENSVEKINNCLILNYDLGLIDDDKDDLNKIEYSIDHFQSTSLLIEENPPQSFSNEDEKMPNFTPKKSNFLKKAKNQKRLGFAGELMVLNYEKKRLSENKDLADRVRHVSKEDGDGAGYDILSFEVDGTEKYIEVKTTKGNKETPFIITENERIFSNLNSSNYYLYRVFNFDKNNFTGKLFTLKGDISENLKLKPQQYIVNGVQSNKLSDK